MSRNNSGPSLKKKFVGLIRQFSQPGCVQSSEQVPMPKHIPRPDTFIHKYLQGEIRSVHPAVVYGQCVEELPPKPLGQLQDRNFAAFTGPNGGLASVNRCSQALQFNEPDVDYIDGDDILLDAQPNAYVTSQKPPPPSDPDLKRSESEEIAGMVNWNRPHERAFGLSTTLYERHPVSLERAGNPIADAFGVVAHENSALLALADGVNWGEKASLAARCAIHGCLNYLNTALFSPASAPPASTTDLFVALLRSFHAAHNLILQEDGMLTTLTAAIVAPLKDSGQYVVCVCNVGDSLAYVYSPKSGVREITQGSHDIYSMRDMRDALGALGPVDGQNPELNNLTCSMTLVESGDLVFLTSDGVSDNFDPVVGKFAMPKKDDKQTKTNNNQENNKGGNIPASNNNINSTSGMNKEQRNSSSRDLRNGRVNEIPQRQQLNSKQQRRQQALSNSARNQMPRPTNSRGGFRQPVSRSKSQPVVMEVPRDPYLPVVEAHQRHELTLLRMEDLLRCGLTSCGPVVHAQALCLEMVHFATKLTVARRRILEDPDLYKANPQQDLSRNDQRNRRRKVCEKLALVPGKLDHATVVAYTVGKYLPEGLSYHKEDTPKLINSNLNLKTSSKTTASFNCAPLASPDSSRSIVSHLEEARPPDPTKVGCDNDAKKNLKHNLKTSSLKPVTLATVEDLDPQDGFEAKISSLRVKNGPIVHSNKENVSPNLSKLGHNAARNSFVETVV